MEVNCETRKNTRTFSFGTSQVRLILGSRADSVAVVLYAHPVFQFSQLRALRNARDSSHKVVRRIRLALYCALGARRRADLVGSGDLEDQGPSVKEVKEGLLLTRNQ
jgi:hypothetical protein